MAEQQRGYLASVGNQVDHSFVVVDDAKPVKFTALAASGGAFSLPVLHRIGGGSPVDPGDWTIFSLGGVPITLTDLFNPLIISIPGFYKLDLTGFVGEVYFKEIEASAVATIAAGNNVASAATIETITVESYVMKDANGLFFIRRREYNPFAASWGPWENLDLEGNIMAFSTPFTQASADNITTSDVFATDTISGAIRPLIRQNNLTTSAITFQDPLTGATVVPAGTETVALRPLSVRIAATDSASLIAVAQDFATLFAAVATAEANYAVIRVNGPAAGAGVAYTTQGAAPTFGIGAGTGKEVNIGGEIVLQSNADITGFQAIGGDAGPYILEIEVYNAAPGGNYS